MRVTSRIHVAALLAVLTAACDDSKAARLPTAPVGVSPNAVSAYVAVSNQNPGVGSPVTVWVRALRGSQVGPIGSFTIRLAYDSTRLRFVDAARSERGMVMANPDRAGVVTAAGAAAEGFGDDQLFVATFQALAPNAMTSLDLKVTELNTVGFEDQRSHTSVARGLFRATR